MGSNDFSLDLAAYGDLPGDGEVDTSHLFDFEPDLDFVSLMTFLSTLRYVWTFQEMGKKTHYIYLTLNQTWILSDLMTFL